MPQWAGLKTFRQPRAQLVSTANQFYFRWWNLISFRLWSIIYLLVLLMAIFLNRKSQADDGGVVLYAVILLAFGVTMVLLNCFFAQIQPRFALPMMELLILSMIILLGVIFRGCEISWDGQRRNQRFRPPPFGSKPVQPQHLRLQGGQSRRRGSRFCKVLEERLKRSRRGAEPLTAE